jgi:hypothetical protein
MGTGPSRAAIRIGNVYANLVGARARMVSGQTLWSIVVFQNHWEFFHSGSLAFLIWLWCC